MYLAWILQLAVFALQIGEPASLMHIYAHKQRYNKCNSQHADTSICRVTLADYAGLGAMLLLLISAARMGNGLTYPS